MMPVGGARGRAPLGWAASVTIEDLGSIGEVVGALATVGTLAYLAVQIRANTRMLRAQTKREQLSSHAAWAVPVAQDPRLAELLQRGMADSGALSDAERLQFIFLFSQIVNVLELAYADAQYAVADSAQLERVSAGTLALLATRGGMSYWRDWSVVAGYPEDFRSFVDSKLAAMSGPQSGGAENSP